MANAFSLEHDIEGSNAFEAFYDSFEIFPDAFPLDGDPPIKSEVHVRSRSPQEPEELADWSINTSESADSVKVPVLQRGDFRGNGYYPLSLPGPQSPSSRGSTWSETTLRPPTGQPYAPFGPESNLQHSGPSIVPCLIDFELEGKSPAKQLRPSKSRDHSRGADSDRDEDLESDGGWGGKKLRPGDPQPQPKLNCLFYLRDPIKDRQCSSCQFKTWAQLREHLFRKHRRPANNSRDECERKTTVTRATFEKPSFITEHQVDLIKRLTQRGKRSALGEVWRMGWEILFDDFPCPPPPYSVHQHPQDDMSNFTEADTRLLASDEFQLWIESFTGVPNVGVDQRMAIYKDFVRTFKARWLGQDTQMSQVSRREDRTDQPEILNPSAAIDEEPCQFPQDWEILQDESGDNSSPSPVVPSPDADMDTPFSTSIRRVLSSDPTYAAEDVISAIKERSEGQTLTLPTGHGSEPATVDSLTPEAPADQEPTSQGTKRKATRTDGRSKASSNKKQKTCAPSDADGDDDDGSDGDAGDDGGGGGGGGNGTSPGPPLRWVCWYCLQYTEITCEIDSCRPTGFSGRDQLRRHLRDAHSPKAKKKAEAKAEAKAKAESKKLDNTSARYYMDDDKWREVMRVMSKIKRPRDSQEWLQAQKDWYLKVWDILFPSSRYRPISPFYTSNEALEERCHRVVIGMMDVVCKRGHASGCSSCKDTQLFTRTQVEEMLEKALQIGLDSLPILAQHFGEHEAAGETQSTPPASAAATTPEDITVAPTSDGTDGATPSTAVAVVEAEGSSTPENALPVVPEKEKPQPWPSQRDIDMQQSDLRNANEVPLENNGNSTVITIVIKPRRTLDPSVQTPKARVEVIMPSTFSMNIENRPVDTSATPAEVTAPSIPVINDHPINAMLAHLAQLISHPTLSPNFEHPPNEAVAPAQVPAPMTSSMNETLDPSDLEFGWRQLGMGDVQFNPIWNDQVNHKM